MTSPRFTDGRNLGLTILGIWLVLALAIGASGVMATLQAPAPQIIILFLTVLALVLALRVSPVREWIAELDPRWLVAFHLTRFVGFYFLVLYDRGELPYAFAVYGGYGDIAVATLAVLVLLFVPSPSSVRQRVIYGVWNLLGFIDILGVIVTATRSFLADPASMAALLRLPLNLLPTFIVPLVIATHVLITLRLRGARVPRWQAA